jgi:hypothetical protein
MTPLETLAHYTREAARVETSAGLAERCGILDKHGKGIRNWIHRAIHSNEPHGQYRHYAPVLSEHLRNLLDGLGLTFAPVDDSVPTAAHVCHMISQMDAPDDAKRVAIAAVYAAGLMTEKEPQCEPTS